MKSVKYILAILFIVGSVTLGFMGAYIYNLSLPKSSIVLDENGNVVTFTIFHGDIYDNEVRFTFSTPGRYVVAFVNRNLTTGNIEVVSGVVRLLENGKGEFEQTFAHDHDSMECLVANQKNQIHLVLKNVNPMFIPPKIVVVDEIRSPFHLELSPMPNKLRQI